MQKRNVLIFLLVGIFVIAAVGGTFYLVRQTTPKPSPVLVVASQTPQPTTIPSAAPNETTAWKIYTNTKYNYSFKYPSNWSQEGIEESIILYDKPINGSGPGPVVSISLETSEGLQFAGGSRVKIEDSIGTKKEIGDKIFEEKISDLLIDGRPAAKFNVTVLPGSQTGATPGIFVKVKNDSKIFDIGLYPSSANNPDKATQIFNQILSTFKFL